MNKYAIKLTRHAIERARERCQIRTSDRLLRYAAIALEKGQTADNVAQSWLKGLLSQRERESKEMRLHNGHIFVFVREGDCMVLVTIYAVPKPCFYHQGVRLQKPKKFLNRYHPECLLG